MGGGGGCQRKAIPCNKCSYLMDKRAVGNNAGPFAASIRKQFHIRPFRKKRIGSSRKDFGSSHLAIAIH